MDALSKIEDKEAAMKLSARVNDAVQLLKEYNARLAAEMTERNKLTVMLKDFQREQQELLTQAEQRLEVSRADNSFRLMLLIVFYWYLRSIPPNSRKSKKSRMKSRIIWRTCLTSSTFPMSLVDSQLYPLLQIFLTFITKWKYGFFIFIHLIANRSVDYYHLVT